MQRLYTVTTRLQEITVPVCVYMMSRSLTEPQPLQSSEKSKNCLCYYSKKLIEKICGFSRPLRCEHEYGKFHWSTSTCIHTVATTLHIILSDKHIDRQQNSDTHKTLKERVSHISAFVFLSERNSRENMGLCWSAS